MEQQNSAPPPPSATGHMKQYVFVDEYNRHKRLKVMRACDGCRKRKIKCDGAVQNGPWPCGACLRLKLRCVPPTLDPDDEQQTWEGPAGQRQFSFVDESTSASSNDLSGSTRSVPQQVHDWASGVERPASLSASSFASRTSPSASGADSIYTPPPFSSQLSSRTQTSSTEYPDDSYLASVSPPVPLRQGNRLPNLMRSHTEASNSSGGDPQEVSATVKELSEQMGSLTIDYTSTAAWINNENKALAETPAVEEVEVLLPPSVSTDSTVRIPAEMMPSDERVAEYLAYFFKYIHPYVPVLNRAFFYEQWRSSRASIPPLLLEGIFACVARYLEKPIEVRRWLALAARHEETFKDIPRLSTIQAMLLLTKAREVIPKRGYYYRSWMAVKYMTTMAIDLGLHEHHDQHRSGNLCRLSKADCMVRTRIWQALLALEILVGAPQGRTDFAVDLTTVDVSVPTPSSEVDMFENQLSRRFTFMTQVFGNVKATNNMWQSLRRLKKDWALDPAFVRHNEKLSSWLRQLPSDMQLNYPSDGSAPDLRDDHFLAYTHIYHHLVVVMHHRPQLQTLLEMKDSRFTEHLEVCLQAAAMMCRIQEALIFHYFPHGLQWMQRGVNFTIYCVLTCTMLHLAAITSPDPVMNSEARSYFTRHMRVLEHCTPGANLEMQNQINALREAFSQDTSKPFELKPTLGLRSPTLDNRSTPTRLQDNPHGGVVPTTSAWSHHSDAASLTSSVEYSQQFGTVGTQSQPAQPTLSYHDTSFQMPSSSSFHPITPQYSHPTLQSGYSLEPIMSNEQPTLPAWDPSVIFNQWTTAFGGPTQAPPPPPMPDPRMAPNVMPMLAQQQQLPQAQLSPYGSQQHLPGNPGALVPEPVLNLPTVTPVMWQDAFTNAYVSGHGQKRYREAALDPNAYAQYSKRRG